LGTLEINQEYPISDDIRQKKTKEIEMEIECSSDLTEDKLDGML